MLRHILEDIRQGMDLDPDDTTHDEEINSMTPEQQFRIYCRWNGLLGSWDEILKEVVLELFIIKEKA